MTSNNLQRVERKKKKLSLFEYKEIVGILRRMPQKIEIKNKLRCC